MKHAAGGSRTAGYIKSHLTVPIAQVAVRRLVRPMRQTTYSSHSFSNTEVRLSPPEGEHLVGQLHGMFV